MEFTVDTNAIRKKMIDRNIKNITDLSKRCGINRNTLADILCGKSKPSTKVMEALISSLGLTPEEAGAIFFARKLT